MKLIEKLAFKASLGATTIGYAEDEVFKAGFEAGFREAHEIILERIVAKIGSTEAANTIGFPFDLADEDA